MVAEPGLSFQSRGRTTLVNGSEETFDIYDVTVLWDGQPRYVDTYVADAMPLVGMLLLDSHSLYVEIVDGGRAGDGVRPGHGFQVKNYCKQVDGRSITIRQFVY